VLLIRAAATLAIVGVLIRVAPGWALRRAERLPRCSSRPSGRSSAFVGRPPVTLQALADAVNRCGRIPLLAGTCLTRAVALLVMSRRSGLDVTLVIGVRRDGAALDAHAWVHDRTGSVARESSDGFLPLWSTR
jgi:hypothetical protein